MAPRRGLIVHANFGNLELVVADLVVVVVMGTVEADLEVVEDVARRLLPKGHHEGALLPAAISVSSRTAQVLQLVETLMTRRDVSLRNRNRKRVRSLRLRCLLEEETLCVGHCSRRRVVLLRLIELEGQILALGPLNLKLLLHGPGWGALGGCILSIRRIFFVFNSPVQDKIGSHLRQQAVDQADDLSASDNLRVDEVAVQVEDQIYDLRRVHALLDVGRQGHLVDTDLLGEAI